jgi:hypothetical protein
MTEPLQARRLTVCIGEALVEDPVPLSGYWCVHRCPENDKHPWEQMRFIEGVALNAEGYDQVLVITHSPYIVDHLNTLMYAAQLPAAKQAEAAEHFLLKNTKAFIHPDQVAAYMFEKDVPVQDIMKRDSGRIDWCSFSKASNYLGDVWNKVDDIMHAKEARRKRK